MADDIHHRRRPKHHEQIFKFQKHERHSRLQIPVHRCHL